VLRASGVALREFFEGTDAMAFMVGAGLIVGRITDSAAAKQEHAAKRRIASGGPDVY